MLQLVAAIILAAAAAPAAQPAPAPAAADAGTAPKAAEPAKAQHPPGPAKAEKPLTEQDKKIAALAEQFTNITRNNLEAAADVLKAIAFTDAKDCTSAAKAVAARMTKHDADQARLQAEVDAMATAMPKDDRTVATGKAFFAVTEGLKKFHATRTERDNAVGAFKGKCPKEGPEVEKSYVALRKKLEP